jgi:Tfp pilus assembly protein PilV
MVSGRRAGLSVIEALVALLLFGAGVLAIAGAASRAARTLREAESRDAAHAMLLSAADSLLPLASPSTGTTSRGAYELSWTVLDSGAVASVVVRVAWTDGTATRTDSLHALAAPAPARLHVVP